MRALVAKLSLLLLSLGLTLVVAEQVLRAVGYEYRPMSIEIGDRGDARSAHLFDDRHFVYDPVLIWRPRPGAETFNGQGYRGPEVELEKPPGTVRVVTVGDSNTLGWAGPSGSNWPGDLAHELAAADPGTRYEVVNAGVWGYTSHQGLGRLREALAFEPDLVLVSFGSNDAHLVTRTDREYADRALDGDRWKFLLDYRLGQLAVQAWDSVDGGEELRHRVPLDEYRNNLLEMAAETRRSGGQPVFLTRPYVGPVRDPSWWKNFGPEYNLATVETAREADAPVIDLFTLFKDESELFEDESHFTTEGHRLAAAIVRRHLEPLID